MAIAVVVMRPRKARRPRMDSVGQVVMAHRPKELEGSIQGRILHVLNLMPGVLALRNNSGAIKKGPRFLRYGLGANGGTSAKGSADVIAFVSVGTFAAVVAIEVKRPGEDLDDHQKTWCERVRQYGVVAGRAESVDEALALVAEARERALSRVA